MEGIGENSYVRNPVLSLAGSSPSPYLCLVIDTGEQTVLVDTGGGEMAPTTGKLRASLEAADIDATAIDVVLITHGHGHADHVGGTLTDGGDPAFSNARCVMSEEE